MLSNNLAGGVRIVALLLCSYFAVSLSGCDKISNLIEKKIEVQWQPLDEALLRKQVELRLVEQVGTVPNPNAAAVLPASLIVPMLQAQIGKVHGIESPKVTLEEDRVIVTVEFELVDSNSQHESSGLDGLKHYRVRGILRVAATPILELERNQVRFAFAFTVLRITKAEVAGRAVPEMLTDAIGTLVTRYLSNINGILNSECGKPSDLQTISVSSCVSVFPSTLANKLDLKDELQQVTGVQNVAAENVNLSLEVKAAAFALNEEGLFLIAKLAGVAFGSDPDSSASISIQDASSARTFVVQNAREIADQDGAARPAVGIKTDLLARAIDYVSATSQITMQVGFEMPSEKFDTEVRLAKKPEFECGRLDCSQQNCTKPNCYNKTEKTCINDGGDFAGIINKLCKETVNVVCDGGRAANDLICNTVQVLDKASCDVGEELKKAGCEANKIFVDKVLGRIGSVSGDYRAAGTYAITLDSGRVEKSLSRIEAIFTASADGTVSGSLKFTPMDHGHMLACVAQWKESFSVKAKIPETRRVVAANRASSNYVEEKGLVMHYVVEPFEISGKVSPSPFDAVFNQHPHLRLNCQLPTAIGDLAKAVKVVDPESDILPDELNQVVTGNVRHQIESLTVDIVVPDQKVKLFDHELLLRPNLNGSSLVYAAANP